MYAQANEYAQTTRQREPHLSLHPPKQAPRPGPCNISPPCPSKSDMPYRDPIRSHAMSSFRLRDRLLVDVRDGVLVGVPLGERERLPRVRVRVGVAVGARRVGEPEGGAL